MENMKEFLANYEPPTTESIAELGYLDLSFPLRKFEGERENNGEIESFSYYYIEKDGKRYRIPVSVLSQVKKILEKEPDASEFKVTRTGEELNTRYFVTRE